MKKKLRLSAVAFVAVALICFTTTANASIITFGAAQDSLAVSDINTTGTLVFANNGGTATVTAGGVTFAGSDILLPQGVATGQLSLGGGLFATSGDADYDALLGSVDFGGGGNAGVPYDLGSFTSGDNYLVQVWYTDSDRAPGERVLDVGSTDSGATGSNVGLDAGGANDLGQFTIGTFTADGNDPDLALHATNFGNAHITAVQVRNITPVPEPTSFAAFGLIAFGVAFRRRR